MIHLVPLMSFLFAGINEADFPAFPKNEGQAKFCVVGTDLAGNAAERPACWSDKIVFFRMSVAVFHYILSIGLVEGIRLAFSPQVIRHVVRAGNDFLA